LRLRAHKTATKGERRGERRGGGEGEEEERESGWRTLAQTHENRKSSLNNKYAITVKKLS
jgi:hypothetical protein